MRPSRRRAIVAGPVMRLDDGNSRDACEYDVIPLKLCRFPPIIPFVKGNYQKQLWTQMSDQARALAKTIRDPDLKLRVLLMAARYLVWAKRSEKTGSPLHGGTKPTD
jgi:hypothetical protein